MTYKYQTNSADLVTLFEQRPWAHCPIHDYTIKHEFDLCETCLAKERREHNERERECRINELSEAIRRAQPITVTLTH